MIPSFAGRVGLAGASAHHNNVKRSAEKRACNLAAGGLYLYPNASSVVDATQPLTFKWDTSCAVNSPNVDLYLYEAAGNIKTWTNIPFSDGRYQVTLKPKWWNDTTTAQLQMSIIDSGAASWDTSSPPGPVFTVNYPESAMYSTTLVNGQARTSTAAVAATQSKDAVFETVSSANTGDKAGISKGGIAAAVVVPLLVLGILIGVAIRFWRARENEKRKRWSQALSTHSNLEWEKGAQPGEKPHSILGRPSIGGRPSMSSYGGNGARPTSSVYAVENNMAGAGAGHLVHFQRPGAGLRSHSADNVSSSSQSQLRSSVVMPDGNVRQSRISFADTARPDRRSRLSFAGDLRPAVQSSVGRLPGASKSASELNTPNRKSAAYATGSALDDEEEDINVSPSQVQGPNGFAEADLRRLSQGQRTGRRSFMSFGGGDKRRESTASALSADDFKSAASARGSVDELRDMEAVMLMRRSMISQHSNMHPDSPNPAYDSNAVEVVENEVPALPAAPSPVAGASTVAYGPDQMLAVYAARGKVSPSPTPSTPTFSAAPLAQNLAPPKPTATRQNSGMRLLTSLGKKANDDAAAMPPPAAPAPGDMRSYVHLNRGTVSSAVIDALPPPGPRGVTSPTGERPPNGLNVPGASATRQSGMSDGSRYSQEVEEEQVGEAQ
ncbi:hypothetical protein CI109_106723 [Kwoniella shandongensis]|uniref:Uncharacterized protein n=1 Tax=Kwoniella shandongensis TaxID=1734106 RepID=A0A5M6C7G5_9TREE|nr:uncharacterized protein CI109_001021 [Kwoniella shandongensis]KAA5530841.1 hypothetical protein CI109_001021 [Kwoniella shandongensis]